MLLDAAKGAIPVYLATAVAGIDGTGLVVVALAPVFGHAFSPFLRGRGIAQYTSDPVFRASLAQPSSDPAAAGAVSCVCPLRSDDAMSVDAEASEVRKTKSRRVIGVFMGKS